MYNPNTTHKGKKKPYFAPKPLMCYEITWLTGVTEACQEVKAELFWTSY